MGLVFSSLRPRQASSARTESKGHPSTEINGASGLVVVVEPPARVPAQNAANVEREDARGKGTELSGSRPPRPDPANSHLSASWLEHDDGLTVASEGYGPVSPHKGQFDHNRLSRSSLAMSDTEMIAHSDTRIPGHRRGSFRDGRPLKNVDESLVNAVSETSALPTDNPVYDGMFVSATQIRAPYEPLFYSRKMILQATKTGVEETQKHAQRLLTFMEQELAATWAKSVEIDEGGCEKIAFEHLWLLYSPGETVFRKAGGEWRAYKVARVETGAHPGLDPIQIFAYYLGFDTTGRSLVPHLELLRVDSYLSERPVGSLEVVPEWYIEKHMESLSGDLRARGRTYWEYRRKPFYKEHRGNAWPAISNNDCPKVMIDHATSSRHGIDMQPERSAPLHCVLCLAEALKLGPWSENPEDMPRHLDVCEQPASVKSVDTDTDGHLLYCPSMVWAFSLEQMSWKLVPLSTLHDISPKDENWNRLCMCEASKTQLDSMASAYFREWEARQYPSSDHAHSRALSFGGGRGYNIRFHGGTGTGKTFTAECLAEKHGRPLYRVPCGSIEITPSVLGPQLCTLLIRAANWGAILLFEDADMFVQECDSHNLQRSALNSVFVHHLSQSDALAIFTTRQKSRVDKSFQSRTNPELYFEPLRFEYQKLIWLHHLRTSSLTKESLSACERFIENKLKDVEKGEYQNMNGLQIEKCVGAALALAKMEARNDEKTFALRKDHIRKVLALEKKSKERIESSEEPSSWIRIPADADADG